MTEFEVVYLCAGVVCGLVIAYILFEYHITQARNQLHLAAQLNLQAHQMRNMAEVLWGNCKAWAMDEYEFVIARRANERN